MLTGYCHYHGGPTIVVDAYEIGDRGYERMTGEAARRRYGNIALPSRRLASPRGRSSSWRRNSWRRCAPVTGPGSPPCTASEPGSTNERDRARLSSLLDDPASPFVQLRRAAPSRSRHLRDQPGTARRHRKAMSAGYCASAGRAIARLAGRSRSTTRTIGPDRPYVCTKVEPRDGGPIRARLRTPTRGWLAEPARTAFRVVGHGSNSLIARITGFIRNRRQKA